MSELSDTVNEIANASTREILLEKIKNLLDALKIPEDIKDIPNLFIHDFRDLSVEESKALGDFLKVKTIKDLAKVTYSQVLDRIALITEFGIPKDKLELLITAAKFIVQAADYKPIKGQKIVLAGLDNAGKTALLKTIKKEVGFSELSSIKPTKGAFRDDLFLSDQEILIVELGGQEEFRKFYIDQPDRFFIETDIIVYLIDIQDDSRYQETVEYLNQILRTLKYLQESPDFIILFHKADPDIVNAAPLFQEKFEYLEGLIKKTFKPYRFQYEIQTSSIFNIVSMTPSFSRMLKGIFSGSALAEEQKIGAIGNLLMKVVDLFLDSETHLNRAISSVNQRLSRLESMIRQSSKSGIQISTTSEKAPSTGSKPLTEAGPPMQKPSGPRGGLSPRAALLSELKQVFGLRGKIE